MNPPKHVKTRANQPDNQKDNVMKSSQSKSHSSRCGITSKLASSAVALALLTSAISALADDIASEEPAADHRLEQRQQAVAALAAIAELPDELRESAALFFVHEVDHVGRISGVEN